ncbi:hypothetical protein QQM79_15430 [Marinobacteraceae bacterium S3BR75-40.1]
MKTIHKYRLAGPGEVTRVKLREGHRVVRSEYLVVEKAVFIWVEEPLNVDIPTREHAFRVALSGEPVADELEYRDTALDPFGPEAYHVFELPAVSAEERPSTSELKSVRAA